MSTDECNQGELASDVRVLLGMKALSRHLQLTTEIWTTEQSGVSAMYCHNDGRENMHLVVDSKSD